MSNNMPKHVSHLSRHNHDIHGGFTSTLAPSFIVPQYFDILQPGDSVYYKTHAFARLQDIVTAFFGEVEVNFDYFFVPLQMLYTPAGSILTQTNDALSSAIPLDDLGIKDGFPLLAVFESIGSIGVRHQDSPFSESFGKSVARLLDGLDAHPMQVFNSEFYVESGSQIAIFPDGSGPIPSIAPWAFAAYQAIYQDYFRNDDLERRDVSAFNFDQYYRDSSFVDEKFIKLRQVFRPSDYFTSVKVSPIAATINGIDPGGSSMNSDILSQVDNFLGSGVTEPYYGSDFNVVRPRDVPSNWTSVQTDDRLSAANIRSLFAVEKYCRIWGRADKTYDDQILAHFGYKVPHDVKHQLTHLKHYRIVLQSDPIYASTSFVDSESGIQQSLGQVGGQSNGVLNSDGEKFTAPVHGVFMCVAHVSSVPRYYGTFSKLHFLNTRLDFPQPEFDKLGMQPLYAYEAFVAQFDNSEYAYRRIGWQYRYQQFKQKYNRVSLAFAGSQSSYLFSHNVYSPWVLSQSVFPKLRNGETDFKQRVLNSNFLGIDNFRQSPFDLNNIMVVPYVAAWSDDWYDDPHLMFQTDPVILEFMCDCKKVSWMSETGEPDL